MAYKTRHFYEFGPYRVDPDHRLLLRENQTVSLQPKAFDILLVLVRNSDKVVLKDELLKAVWPDTFVEESNLAQNIFVLRKALDDAAGKNRYIVTVPGRGYRFAEKVQVVGEEPEEESLVVESHIRSRLVIEEQGTPRAILPARRWNLRMFVLPGAVLAVVVATGLALYSRRPKLTEKDTVVLADFANSTGDPVFDSTLRQGLSSQLEQSPFLNLLSDQRIAQTLSLMTQPKDARLTPELAKEVCQRTASVAVLDGTIGQVGSRYLLTLNAINCSSGETLASTEAQANDKNHVLDALGKIASAIRKKLGESLASVQKYDTPPEEVTTASLEALNAYSLGSRVMNTKNDYPAAIPLFQQAINIDPKFAMAYLKLGINFYNLDQSERAAENLQKAFDLREKLSEREKLYIAASRDAMAAGNMESARKSYELWAQLYPRDQFAMGNLGVVYWFLGEDDKALATFQEAFKLNPGNAVTISNIVGLYMELGRLDEAKATALKAKTLNLDSNRLHANLYMISFVQHDTAGMEREAAQLLGKPGWENQILQKESDTAAYEGHFLKARELSSAAAEAARRADNKEAAAAYLAESAVREALVGNQALAKRQAKEALTLSEDREVVTLAATALGLAGDSAQSMQFANELNSNFPENTVVQYNSLLTIRLAAALQNVSKSTELVTVSDPYELVGPNMSVAFCCYPVYLRGKAYIAMKQGAKATAEFRKILEHPALVGNGPIGALAHLEMGRAYALAGDLSRAKSSYSDFLALWKNADLDIPIYKQAKAEYAKLQ